MATRLSIALVATRLISAPAVAQDSPPDQAHDPSPTTQQASAEQPASTLSGEALVEPEEAAAPALFRVNHSGDLMSRPALTGDWGGVRNELAENGCSVQLDIEQLIQGSARGGADTTNAFRYSGS